MSLVAIRAAFEVALAAMTPALSTAYENAEFTPVVGTPFQVVYLIPAEPDNLEMSGALYWEQGFFQINLHYPLGAGPAAAFTRAELVRSVFYRGASFSSGGTTVSVERTPEIGPGLTENDRFIVPIRVRFFAQITRS
jgi:hypothetical protein